MGKFDTKFAEVSLQKGYLNFMIKKYIYPHKKGIKAKKIDFFFFIAYFSMVCIPHFLISLQ